MSGPGTLCVWLQRSVSGPSALCVKARRCSVALCVRPQCSLGRGPLLCVGSGRSLSGTLSGPNAHQRCLYGLYAGAQRSLCRGLALFVSGPSALCRAPAVLSQDSLCRAHPSGSVGPTNPVPPIQQRGPPAPHPGAGPQLQSACPIRMAQNQQRGPPAPIRVPPSRHRGPPCSNPRATQPARRVPFFQARRAKLHRSLEQATSGT